MPGHGNRPGLLLHETARLGGNGVRNRVVGQPVHDASTEHVGTWVKVWIRHQAEPALRDDALHLLAWARLLAGRPEQAREALRRFSGQRDPDPALAGAVALDLGETRRAVELLQEALPDPFAANRFVQAVAESRQFQSLTSVSPDALSDAHWRELHEAALEAGDFDAAFVTASVLFERGPDAEVAFDAACALSRSGRLDDAHQWLERAREQGFADVELLDEHEDLAALRALPSWEPLRATFET